MAVDPSRPVLPASADSRHRLAGRGGHVISRSPRASRLNRSRASGAPDCLLRPRTVSSSCRCACRRHRQSRFLSRRCHRARPAAPPRKDRPFVGELEAVMAAKRLQRLGVIGGGIVRFRPGRNGSAAQRQVFVRHHHVGIDALFGASPSQVGQAPPGLLKENSRGSISGMVKPETGQANSPENRMRSWVSFFDLLALSPASFRGRQRLVGKFGNRQPVGELEAGFQ